ncbi:hypothetical protein BVY02_01705, partial [bacterium J17]
SLQTVFIRLIGISVGSSEYAFSMVVAVFVLMLALGAWIIAGRKEYHMPLWANQLAILLGLFAVYFLVPYMPYGAHILRTMLTSIPPNFYFFHLILFLVLLAVLAIPVGAMGSTMPLLFSNVDSRFSDLGSSVGRLYSVNTLGCVLGALIGGHFFLYTWNLDQIFLFCGFLVGLSLLLVYPWSEKTRILRTVLVSCFALIAAISPLFVGPWNKMYFAVGTFRLRSATPLTFAGRDAFYQSFLESLELLAYKDGPNTSVAVIQKNDKDEPKKAETDPELSRAIYVNGKSDGNTVNPDRRTTKLLAHLPALFAGEGDGNSAVVGFGTGISVGSLALHNTIKEIDVIEISPFVREFAEFFRAANQEAANDPKVKWNVADAYRVLGASGKKYSVIVSEPSNPWVTGVERLYAKEFFQIVSDSLDDEGVYAQWIHIYDMSNETLGLVINTFSSVFPVVRVFENHSDLIVVGSKQPLGANVIERVSKRFELKPLAKDLADVGITSVEDLLSREILLPKEMFRSFGYHTLEFPRLAFQAGKDFFGVKQANVRSLHESPPLLPWGTIYEKRSLLAQYLKSGLKEESKIDYLQIAENICLKKPALTRDWNKQSKRCLKATIGLLSRDKLDYPDGIQALADKLRSEIRIVQFMLDSTKEPMRVALSIDEANVLISLFVQFNSIFLPLDADKLIAAVQICFNDQSEESLNCQAELALAAAVAGKAERAEKLLVDLEAKSTTYWPQGKRKQLHVLVKNAKEAASAYPNSP